jgi:hypothetical protein
MIDKLDIGFSKVAEEEDTMYNPLMIAIVSKINEIIAHINKLEKEASESK